MWFYVLICLCFALIGVVGMQMLYMAYFDRLDKERKKYVRVLERRCHALTKRLEATETRLRDQERLFEFAELENEDGDEAWADVIDER